VKLKNNEVRKEENIQRVMCEVRRNFSVIRVPYTLKLLIQELGGMNLQLRIITADNINQCHKFKSIGCVQ
jgi:DNA-directed RNA polymerase beta subunit